MTFSNNIQGSDERTVDKVHSIIKEFVKQGVIKRERIDESYVRIMKLKRRLNQGDQSIYYQQALQKSAQALEDADRKLQEANEKLALSKEVQEEPSRKKKKRRKDKS